MAVRQASPSRGTGEAAVFALRDRDRAAFPSAYKHYYRRNEKRYAGGNKAEKSRGRREHQGMIGLRGGRTVKLVPPI